MCSHLDSDMLSTSGNSHPKTVMPDAVQVVIAESSLGLVLVAQSRIGVCAVILGDSQSRMYDDLRLRFPGATLNVGTPDRGRIADKVLAVVEEPAQQLDIPLDMGGTEFQQAVWQVLREIPAGMTMSYQDVAHRLGRPKAARAVAQACAANRLAVVVPCHRVVRSDGAMGGYRWGIERKRTLLEREAVLQVNVHHMA